MEQGIRFEKFHGTGYIIVVCYQWNRVSGESPSRTTPSLQGKGPMNSSCQLVHPSVFRKHLFSPFLGQKWSRSKWTKNQFCWKSSPLMCTLFYLKRSNIIFRENYRTTGETAKTEKNLVLELGHERSKKGQKLDQNRSLINFLENRSIFLR